MWTPQPGMKIKNVTNGNMAVIVRLAHRADRDTGAMWVINEDGGEKSVALGEAFIYEANLQTYWVPIVEEKKK